MYSLLSLMVLICFYHLSYVKYTKFNFILQGYLTQKPQRQKPLGYISEFNILITDYDYSMIVATRPDPTVRPPSRYQTGVLRCANGGFSCDSWGKMRIFRCVRVVLGDFVIMVLSLTYLL